MFVHFLLAAPHSYDLTALPLPHSLTLSHATPRILHVLDEIHVTADTDDVLIKSFPIKNLLHFCYHILNSSFHNLQLG